MYETAHEHFLILGKKQWNFWNLGIYENAWGFRFCVDGYGNNFLRINSFNNCVESVLSSAL